MTHTKFATKAITVAALGGAEMLRWSSIEIGAPVRNEVLLRHTAIGMNLHDIGRRAGAYPGPPPPYVPGIEGVGFVEAVGEGVSNVRVGDRVGYGGLPEGSYAEHRLFPADRLVPIPTDIDDTTAAAVLFKGMTAEMLMRRVYSVTQGTVVLIHAAGGATGLLMCQLAHHLGAKVFGTVSSEKKAELAAKHGCHHPIVYTREDFAARVVELTDGRGVDVVFDSVGKDTFERSLQCLRPTGTMAHFGVASGMPAPLTLMALDPMTAQYFVRPSIFAYTKGREDLLALAARTFEDVRTGVLRARIARELPLSEAANGHRLVESRAALGALVYRA